MSESTQNNTINDEEFGSLTWREDLDNWSGIVELADRIRVKLYIESSEGKDISITTETRQAFKTVAESAEKMRQKACDELLSIYNRSWNEGEPIDAETFMNLLSLESIRLYPDGSTEIYFDDGGLFWGHTVIVSLSKDGDFYDAEIAG